MATPAQIAANRQNAQRSTGPRTPEGKARSARNALRHGFASREFIVPDDERENFESLRTALAAELKPAGALAEILFTQLLHAAWNLHRIALAEAQLYDGSRDPLTREDLYPRLELLARYRARFERSFHRTYRLLREHQTNQVLLSNDIPRADAAVFPVLADVHSIHKARANAPKVYAPEDLLSPEETESMRRLAQLRDDRARAHRVDHYLAWQRWLDDRPLALGLQSSSQGAAPPTATSEGCPSHSPAPGS